jgi:hypothetical protein
MPRALIAVALFTAISACGEEHCEVSSERGPWGEYSQANLPKGECRGLRTCTLVTQDTCPNREGPGPQIDWKCSCIQDEWVCREIERSTTACLP